MKKFTTKTIFGKKSQNLGIEYKNEIPDICEDSKSEINAFEKKMKEDKKNENKQNKSLTSTDYYSVLIFKSEQQRDYFIEKLNLITSENNRYINGVDMAKKLNIDLPECNLKNIIKFNNNKVFDIIEVIK